MNLKTIIKNDMIRNYITTYQHQYLMLIWAELIHKQSWDKYFIPREDITNWMIDFFEKNIDKYKKQ